MSDLKGIMYARCSTPELTARHRMLSHGLVRMGCRAVSVQEACPTQMPRSRKTFAAKPEGHGATRVAALSQK